MDTFLEFALKTENSLAEGIRLLNARKDHSIDEDEIDDIEISVMELEGELFKIRASIKAHLAKKKSFANPNADQVQNLKALTQNLHTITATNTTASQILAISTDILSTYNEVSVTA